MQHLLWISLILSRISVITSKDWCIQKYGGVELDYMLGSSTAWTFDLCDVINCAGKNSSYRGYDTYLCWDVMASHNCHKNIVASNPWCGRGWGNVIKFTGTWTPTMSGYEAGKHIDEWGKLSFQRDFSGTQNPLTLSTKWERSLMEKEGGGSTGTTPLWLILGVDVYGRDPMGLIKINFRRKPNPVPESTASPVTSTLPPQSSDTEQNNGLKGTDYAKWPPTDIASR